MHGKVGYFKCKKSASKGILKKLVTGKIASPETACTFGIKGRRSESCEFIHKEK